MTTIAPNSDIFSIWDKDAIQLFYTSSNNKGLCSRKLLHSPPPGYTPKSISFENPVAPVTATQITGAANSGVPGAADSNGRLEIFYADPAGVIYRNWQDDDGTWSHHRLMESPTTTAKRLAVSQNSDGRLELFYVGGDGNLYHNSQAVPDSGATPGGAWNGGEPIAQASVAATEVAAAQNADGRLEIFFTTPAGILYHDWQLTPGGAWHGPALLFTATTKATKITAIQAKTQFLFLFYIGADGLLRRSEQMPDLSWSAPAVFGPGTVGAKSVAAVRNSFSLGTQLTTQTLEVFYIGADDILYHDWQLTDNGPDWNGRKQVYSSNDKAGRLSATRAPYGRLELVFVDPSNNLNWIWQDVTGAETWVSPQPI